MSIMFLNDVRERPVARLATVSLSVVLYAMAALVFVIVAPLALSYVMGGLAPMLVLTVYLLPLVPVLALVAGGSLMFALIRPVLTASIMRHAETSTF